VVKSVALHSAPSAAELLARARELHPIIAAEGPRSEEAGRLTGETVAAMRGGADLFSLLIPECFGGAEASTTDALRVIEAVSYADGSAGWVLMAAQCCTGMAAAYLGRDGAAEVFGKGIPIICGQGAANGKAVVDGNGYRLTGHWSYGSGVLHSDYTHSGAIVYEKKSRRRGSDWAPSSSMALMMNVWKSDAVGGSVPRTGSGSEARKNIVSSLRSERIQTVSPGVGSTV